MTEVVTAVVTSKKGNGNFSACGSSVIPPSSSAGLGLTGIHLVHKLDRTVD